MVSMIMSVDVSMSASMFNVTSGGVINGKGRSSYASLTGPGTPNTPGWWLSSP